MRSVILLPSGEVLIQVINCPFPGYDIPQVLTDGFFSATEMLTSLSFITNGEPPRLELDILDDDGFEEAV
jgi:hypothetical protein